MESLRHGHCREKLCVDWKMKGKLQKDMPEKGG
jgi:hypothetical protein